MSSTSGHRLPWVVVVVLSLISIALVIRRLLIMAAIIPAIPAGAKVAVDTGLKNNPALLLVHILAGALFVITGFILMRKPALQNYRWLNRLFAACGALIGATAIVMPLVARPIGGISESAAAIFFGGTMLTETGGFCISLLQKDKPAYKNWLLRMVILALAIATTRPVMAIAAVFGHLTPAEFLGTAFWISFTIHLSAAEAWIRRRYSHGKPPPSK